METQLQASSARLQGYIKESDRPLSHDQRNRAAQGSCPTPIPDLPHANIQSQVFCSVSDAFIHQSVEQKSLVPICP